MMFQYSATTRSLVKLRAPWPYVKVRDPQYCSGLKMSAEQPEKKPIEVIKFRKITVGVCNIAKNEEALIGRMLDSVIHCDQVVVVDTGSQDKTIEIAEKYTKNVFRDFTWTDSFADAQNHAKSKMKTDWILSVDSDEWLNVPFREVRKAIALGKDYISCKMVAEGSLKNDFEFSRLFRNDPGIYWCQAAHKHLNLPGAGEPVGNVKIIYGYSPAHYKDPDRTLRILEHTIDTEKDPGRNLYYLGREYWYKRDYKMCTQTLGKYVQASGWDAEKAEAFLVMSQAYSAQGLDEDARYACMHAIVINSNFREAIEWMANISHDYNAAQWRRMAKTASNRDVLWDRVPAEPIRDVIFCSTHNDDEVLFGAFTLMRLRPLVIIVTESFIQPERGDIGCDADTRRKETIEAMKLLGCPVLFMGIKDTELTEDILRERFQLLNPETIYIPALQGGNAQHDMVNKVALEVFGKKKCEQYCTYTKTELYTTGGWEIKPTWQEMDLKNKALDCYKSQLALPSTAPHFAAVRNKSEWLI